MIAEQAIHTSLETSGRSGYHMVARSAGISDDVARVIASYCPSNGSLMIDSQNPASLNHFLLPDGRSVVARTCLGPPEYSGRGGRCLYTHALVLDRVENGPPPCLMAPAVYRQALALGHLTYRPIRGPRLQPVELGHCAGSSQAVEPGGVPDLSDVVSSLRMGQTASLRYPGDRIAAAAIILQRLPAELLEGLSYSTSLQPSSARGYRLSLIA